MRLLLDVGDVPEACCEHGIDVLAKGMAEGSTSIWRPMENPWARVTVAAFTERYQNILSAMQEMLAQYLGGSVHVLHKAEPWVRWDEAKFEQVRNYLEGLDPKQMTLDDYLLLVDYIIQRYLPDGVIDDLAQFLAVRSLLMGKVQANLEVDRRVTNPMIATLAALVPTTFAAVPLHALTPTELAVLEYGKAHAAENIRHVTSIARHRMAQIVIEHAQAAMLGQKEGTWKYAETRLFDEFAALNRDFRRIAVTEGGEMVNQGYIVARGSGQKVKRIEAYQGACDFCKSINGLVFEIVDADAKNKDGDTQIWPGKTNIGRSASRMKREGDHLVERPEDEMWWAAAGVQHPHCRGAWIPVTTKPPEVSQEFFDWMQATLDKAKHHAPPY